MKISVQKSILMLLFIGVSLTACEKEKPEPDLATKASGKYTYSEMIFREQTIPASQTTIKGTIIIKKRASEAVDVVLDIRQKTSNDEFMAYPIDDVTISSGENNAINFFQEGKRVAQLKGNKLYLNGVDESDESFTLVATK